ncbi:alpha/beta fold hydrolase [Brevibacillus fluminis]|uniref:alpha/beta fold hydrolase n=1 Tax=Brevibacillus fluminis TaxID=511487 RepID=UPI003F8CD8D6
MKLFVTGGTGVIGKEVLKQLQHGDEEIFVLCRSKEKAERLFNQLGVGESGRIDFLIGDLQKERLGLDAAAYEKALTTDVIIHAGGTMDITLAAELARKTFRDGAVHLADLARTIHQTRGLRQFVHVVGYMSPFGDENVDREADVFSMDSFLQGEGAYERMKFLADLYIRQQAQTHGYPLAVMNPSTVIGARPTGETEQVGGLGILVDAMNRGLMPVIPGGANHWLPLVTNDDVARAVVRVVRQAQPTSGTYTLLGDKATSHSMPQLLALMARQMRIPVPKLAIPLGWMQKAMGWGLARMTGIPKESMAFITEREFPNESAKQLLAVNGGENERLFLVDDVLPFAIADLDYRLTNQPGAGLEQFERRRLANLSAFYKKGTGQPWVLLHGLFSHAEALLPLATQLHEKTGNPVWLIDLPGFGRSPSLDTETGSESVETIVNALHESLAALPDQGPIRLVGHSWGAYLAGNVAPRLGAKLDQLILLQPAFEAPHDRLLKWASATPKLLRLMLRRLRPSAWAKRMIDAGAFSSASEHVPIYAKQVADSLRSRRIAYANAHAMQLLFHRASPLAPDDLLGSRATIVWGLHDKAYTLPAEYAGLAAIMVPYDHQFPLAHPEETAALLHDHVYGFGGCSENVQSHPVRLNGGKTTVNSLSWQQEDFDHLG